MQDKYDAKAVEQAVRRRWEERGAFAVKDDDPRPKYYSLCMWPYPSGDLHVGHLRNYSIGDVWARHKRMQGFNVLQPMGWDAFGKDAELKARKEGIHPAAWVESNTANMRRELRELGYMVDWSRELATCNPKYYRWEQHLFLRMWEKDLVYYSPTKVLWDKATGTVVARRDVDDGKVARQDVEVREFPAYQMRLRRYGEELLAGLAKIAWPEKIVKDQQYLIGRSEGMSIRFALEAPAAGLEEIEVYTTRPDTLMGVTYMAVHASHPLAAAAAERDPKIKEFCEQALQILPIDAGNADSEKNGVALDVRVLNPVSGEPVPVWVADYVIDDYGSGALMGVPAHDERDFSFARKYGIPIVRVNALPGADPAAPVEQAEVAKGVAVNSGPLDGLDLAGCVAKLEELLGPKGKARRDHNMSLRDWPINRQMYWGTPIPIIKCAKCGLVPVPDEDLPVELPLDVDFLKEGLASHPEFVNAKCPKCGADAQRECDTMDTFVNSAWYYARFACRDAADEMVAARAAPWLPCDHYFGGDEHAQGHLVYARFIHKVMRDLKILPPESGDEPFAALLCQGMVLGSDRKKMSKSQDNTVMAKDILERYGADTARMYIIGIGNPKDAYPWNEEHVRDHALFLEALWTLARERREQVAAGADAEPAAANGLALKRLQAAIDRNLKEQRFNNLVFGGIHSIRNLVRDNPEDAGLQHQGFAALLKTLNLIAPHVAEELWAGLGYEGLLIDASWWEPIAAAELQGDEQLYVVQVNGRKRDELTVAAGLGDEEVIAAARACANVARHLEGKQVAQAKVVRKPGGHGIVFFVAKG
ncbi:MAG: leucine--tRNA ligase [Betaproteobacteria bacterium AqS2]|uniref:Leucine--tRNA ligase n=1 Tax=Candidatus Amphirhobacter heronislandensis TaxID=1732024 RepID=A0A930UH63_9GAMM|nr:leucine--tRNA ligase [Betaproteobacteria bacterium AqS2]